MSTAEITAGLADLIGLVEKGQADTAGVVAALNRQTDALRALLDKETPAPVVHAAPTVNFTAPKPADVNIAPTPVNTVVHVHEAEAKSKKVRLTVNRNSSGFIESLDVETLTE